MKKLHVIFKTHLDIGFTDLAENVIQTYLNDFIPNAVSIGKENEKFIWTVGSWLVNYYLNREDVSDEAKNEFQASLKNGNICWHGLPFTTHTELMDKKLFEYGLSLSQNLDREYGKKTISAKMTDVPGHTIGMLPLMVAAGLKYLHIGVNPSSGIPNVPEMFLWKDRLGNEIVVHYDTSYGSAFVKKNWDEGIYFAHSHDNMGPPKNAKEVEEIISSIQNKYKEYEIEISTLDHFAEYVWQQKESLPIVFEEIGDSWIHGIASDPKKISEYRTLLQLRDKWISEGTMTVGDNEYNNFSSQIILIPEHTWGVNSSLYLPDYENYLIDNFNKARKVDKINFLDVYSSLDYFKLMQSINMYVRDEQSFELSSYKTCEYSWSEQREYVNKAIATLTENHQAEVMESFDNLRYRDLQFPGATVIFGKTYIFGNFQFKFDADGSIKELKINERSLLQEDKRIGRFIYEKFDEYDFQNFLYEYSRINRDTGSWVFVDFAKRGIEAIPEITHDEATPYVEKSSMTLSKQLLTVEFSLKFSEELMVESGLPNKIALRYIFNKEQTTFSVEIKCANKKANRMPEAYWFEISLLVDNPSMWRMNKLGMEIAPQEVVSHGNRQMHSLDSEAMKYYGADGNCKISIEYTPLISFGGRKLLNFKDQVASLNDGIFINLYNNVWGTNFAAWYEGELSTKIIFDFTVNTLSHD